MSQISKETVCDIEENLELIISEDLSILMGREFGNLAAVLSDARKGLHDLGLNAFLIHTDEEVVKEPETSLPSLVDKLGLIPFLSEEGSEAIIGGTPEGFEEDHPFRLTPDYAYIQNVQDPDFAEKVLADSDLSTILDSNVPSLIIGDFAIRRMSTRAAADKVHKYRNFQKCFDPSKIKVRIEAEVVGYSNTEIENWSDSLNVEFEVKNRFKTCAQRYMYVESEVLSRHLMRDAIRSSMHDAEIKKIKAFHVKPIDLIKLTESGFGTKVFHSVSDMFDMFQKRGRFESYFGELNSTDEHFIDRIVDYLKVDEAIIRRMSREDMKDKVVNQTLVVKAVNEFESNLTIPASDPSHKVWIGAAKIVPIPYVSLNIVSEKKEIALRAIENGSFTVKDHTGIAGLINLLDGAGFTPAERYFFVNGPVRVSDRSEKESLRIDRELGTSRFLEKGFMVSNRRTIKISNRGRAGELYREICVTGGTTRIEKVGKDQVKQYKTDTLLSIDDSSSEVDDLVEWLEASCETQDHSTIYEPVETTTDLTLSQELKVTYYEEMHELLNTIYSRNISKFTKFYEKFFTDLIMMCQTSASDDEFLFNTMGSNNMMIIVQGGPKVQGTSSSRSVWLVFKMNSLQTFPMKSSCKFTIHKNSSGEEFYYSNAFRVDEIMLSHYVQSHKFYIDVSFCTLTDLSIKRSTDMSKDDIRFHFAIKFLVRLTNDSNLSAFIQTSRYTVVGLNSIINDLTAQLDDMRFPIRKKIQLYFVKNFIKNLRVYLLSSKIKLSSPDAALLKKEAEMYGSTEDRTVVNSKRLFAEGYHTTFTETMNEFYISNTVSKKHKSKTQATVKCMEKLIDSRNKYKRLTEGPHRELAFGYSSTKDDSEFALELLRTDISHGVMSAKAVSIGSKLMGIDIEGHEQQIRNSLSTGKLFANDEVLATNKSIVKDRSETIQKAFREKKFSDSKRETNYRFVKFSMLSKKIKKIEIEADKRTKAVEVIIKYIMSQSLEEDMTPMNMFEKMKNDIKTFYLEMFPKEQFGPAREIAIQDLYTRIHTFFAERVSEEIAKFIPEEMITDKSKFIKQTNMVHEALASEKKSDEETVRAFFKNIDHTRWGPMMIMMGFICSFTGTADKIHENLFENMSMIFVKMANKVVEIPKAIYTMWHSEFEVNDDNFMVNEIKKFLEKGDITFPLNIGMMQGLLHVTSTLLACGRVKFSNILKKRILGERFKEKSQVSSDDKFDTAISRASSTLEHLHNLLISEKIDEITGKLFNIKQSDKKSGAGTRIAEFNSNFMVNGSSTVPKIVRYSSMSVLPKGLSYSSDVKHGISAITTLSKEGVSGINMYFLQRSYKLFIDNMYHMKAGERNHIERDREFLPIELGGYPDLSAVELSSSPIKFHMWKCVTYSPDVIKNEIGYLAKVSLDTSLKNFAETDYESNSFSNGITEIAFTMKSHSKVRDLRRAVTKAGLSIESVREIINKNPFLPFSSPSTKIGMLAKLGSRLFSNTSHIALAYDNDVSNVLRMMRNSLNSICTIGRPTFDEEVDSNGKKTLKPASVFSISRTFKESLNFVTGEAAKGNFIPYMGKVPSLYRMSVVSFNLVSLLKRAVLTRDDTGAVVSKGCRNKGTFKKLIVPSSHSDLMNNAFSVVMYFWFPSFPGLCANALKNEFFLESDMRKIRKEFDFIKDTIEETLSSLGLKDDEESRYMLVSNVASELVEKERTSDIMLLKFKDRTKDLYFFLNYAMYHSFESKILLPVIKPKEISTFGFRFTSRPTSDLSNRYIEVCRAIVTLFLFAKKKYHDADKAREFKPAMKLLLEENNALENNEISLMEFIRKVRFEDILSLIAEPKLIKSMAIIYSIFSEERFSILDEFFNKHHRVHYSYLREQDRDQDNSFITESPVDFCVSYHGSVARYTKTIHGKHTLVNSKLTLDIKTDNDLEPILKLIVSYTFKSGYSGMPTQILSKKLETSYFNKKEDLLHRVNSHDVVLTLNNNRVRRTKFEDVSDKDLVFGSIVEVGEVSGAGKVRFDTKNVEIHDSKGTWEISYTEGERTFRKTVLSINNNVFDLKTIALKGTYFSSGITSDIDFIVSRNLYSSALGTLGGGSAHRSSFASDIPQDGLSWVDMDMNLALVMGNIVTREYDYVKTMTWEDMVAEYSNLGNWADLDDDDEEAIDREGEGSDEVIIEEGYEDSEIGSSGDENDDMEFELSDMISALEIDPETAELTAFDTFESQEDDLRTADIIDFLKLGMDKERKEKTDKSWVYKSATSHVLEVSYKNFCETNISVNFPTSISMMSEISTESLIKDISFYLFAGLYHEKLKNRLKEGKTWTTATLNNVLVSHLAQKKEDGLLLSEAESKMLRERKTVLNQISILVFCNSRMNLMRPLKEIDLYEADVRIYATKIRAFDHFGSLEKFVSEFETLVERINESSNDMLRWRKISEEVDSVDNNVELFL